MTSVVMCLMVFSVVIVVVLFLPMMLIMDYDVDMVICLVDFSHAFVMPALLVVMVVVPMILVMIIPSSSRACFRPNCRR